MARTLSHRCRSGSIAPQQRRSPETPRASRRGQSATSRFRSVENGFDLIDIVGSHDAPDLHAILEIDQGRPQLHLEGTSERPALAIFDFDVPHSGTLAQCSGDISLRSLAIAAPARTELDDGRLRRCVDFLTSWFIHRVILGENMK